ncbi:MAG: imidazolonepropionase [Thermoplasmata archaeon]
MDYLITGISGIIGPAKRKTNPVAGSDANRITFVEGEGIFIRNGIVEDILDASGFNSLKKKYRIREIDARGNIVMPGFVDSHTHVVFSGTRENEFYEKLAGMSYLEIQERGGGIYRTFRDVASSSETEIFRQTMRRIYSAVSNGTTTMEMKTGYGIDRDNEAKLIHVMNRISGTSLINVKKTFLGLHVIPPGFNENEYTDQVCNQMLPEFSSDVDFADIFCDMGAFGTESLLRLENKAEELGIPLRMHSNEIADIGCLDHISGSGVVSVDHLIKLSDRNLEAIAKSGAMATLLPITAYSLDPYEMPDYRRFMNRDIPVSIATDCSPSTYSSNILYAIYLGVRFSHFTIESAINAVTVNPAYSLGISSERGSIGIGKKADLLVLDVDDYKKIAYEFDSGIVRYVMVNGIPVIADRSPGRRLRNYL